MMMMMMPAIFVKLQYHDTSHLVEVVHLVEGIVGNV